VLPVLANLIEGRTVPGALEELQQVERDHVSFHRGTPAGFLHQHLPGLFSVRRDLSAGIFRQMLTQRGTGS
jgi:hypothetical protein